jgi:hypothetical protein
MTEVPYATADEATRPFEDDVVVETPDGPRRYRIRKSTPADRMAMQEECIDEVGILDLEAANVLAIHRMVVKPELTLEQAADIPEVVTEQLVRKLNEHSGRTTEQIALPDPGEGADVARHFRLEGPDSGPDAAGGDAAPVDEVAAAEGAPAAGGVVGA